MGFHLELFVDKPIDEEFICSICHDVLKDPVMVNSGCEHVFCRSCINDWNANYQDRNTCPLDRKPISAIIAPPRVVISLVNKLKLHCQFNTLGCNEILTVEGILDHETCCRFNPDGIADCQGCGEAKLRKIEHGAPQCLEYLKAKVNQLTNENADLKRKFAAAEGDKNNSSLSEPPTAATTANWKPDGIYAVCNYEHPGGNSYLDLKLGEMIEIEIPKEIYGENKHSAIKNNGVKGLVRAPFVRILTYEKLMEGYEFAQCKFTKILPLPMLSFQINDVIEIICKDIDFDFGNLKCNNSYVPQQQFQQQFQLQMWMLRNRPPNNNTNNNNNLVPPKVWLVTLNGKCGYFNPSNAIIRK